MRPVQRSDAAGRMLLRVIRAFLSSRIGWNMVRHCCETLRTEKGLYYSSEKFVMLQISVSFRKPYGSPYLHVRWRDRRGCVCITNATYNRQASSIRVSLISAGPETSKFTF